MPFSIQGLKLNDSKADVHAKKLRLYALAKGPNGLLGLRR